MKKIIVAICLLFLVKLLIAQDIIVKKDGSRIKSKIIETSRTEIKYKDFNDINGPIYTLKMKEVKNYTYGEKTKPEVTPEPEKIEEAKPIEANQNKNSQKDITNYQDLVFLRTGEIIKCSIIERVPEKYIKVETPDKFVQIYQMDKIEKIIDEEIILSQKILDVDKNEYGSHFSSGIALGGGGIVGIPIRVFLHRNIPFEVAVHFRPTIFLQSTNNNGTTSLSSIEFYPDILLSGEFDFFFSRKYIPNKRVRLSGMFIKGGYSFGSRFDGVIGALGWQYERFKINNKNSSLSFGLGAGFYTLQDKYAKPQIVNGNLVESVDEYYTKPMLYWKVAWNFFIRTKRAN